MTDTADVLDSEWLDTKHLARKLRRHPATVRRWIRIEGLKAVRLRTGPFMIHRDELSRFLDSRATTR